MGPFLLTVHNKHEEAKNRPHMVKLASWPVVVRRFIVTFTEKVGRARDVRGILVSTDQRLTPYIGQVWTVPL